MANKHTPADLMKGVMTGAADVAKGVASSIGTVRALPEKVSAAMPSKHTVKEAFGKALVTGGKALIDPRATIGEMAVKMGEGLLAEADRLRWFVVRIDDEGKLATFPFVKRDEAEAFFNQTRSEFPRQFLCEAVSAPATQD
jgi:hypothetical protein